MQLKAYGFDVPVHQAAIDNRQRTQQFTSDIRTLATVAAVHPDWPIYVDADHIWDFEMVLTLNAWMAWEHVTNPLFLRMSEPPVDLTGNPFSEALWATMKGASAEAAFGYRPLQARNPDRDAAHHCIKIVSILPWFAQAADGACTAVLLHWY